MNFINPAPRPGLGGTPTTHASKGPCVELSMYKEVPTGEISLEEFEEYALDRLRVLKAIEEAKLRSKSEDIIQADVELLLKKHMHGTSRQQTYRKDVLSHHILRLAYCRTADLRNWLLAQEALLFKFRFKALGRSQRVEFFSSMGLPYHAISDAEYDELAGQLAAVLRACGDYKAKAMASGSGRGGDTHGLQDIGRQAGAAAVAAGGRPLFYKVPFQAVPDLVGGRRVLLQAGQAYVGEDQVYSLVVGAFRTCLSASLVEAARAWGAFSAAEADRLAPLVDSLPSRSVYGSDSRKVPVGEVSAGQLAGLMAGRHFPLCMSVMYERLANEHHLKHWGLQQFTLFLKAIGLPLEQALLFFRQQFSPRTAGDKFNKEYAYNVRYNYGQEGKRQDWSEWSCVKVISQEVGGACSAAGECNGGCPYKTYDANQLRAALTRLNCNDKVIREVVDKARGKHYQLACGLAFEGITGSPQETGINKPSEFYAASIELATQRAAAAAGGSGGGEQQGQQQEQQQGQQPSGGSSAL
ncbi:eukaryotic and archaeal DNA primase, large subunit-domain-containing protein [Scenedesmus sp. NREL 46B-D3]|nr:eukaryotic and archaeal DNA primase, large subunit-domain-containing protein [Scenedesmus sp. NREL 46B-D3]